MSEGIHSPWSEDDLVLVSALEHWRYCPRQCALIHLERTFDENVYTLRARLLHGKVDQPDHELREGVRIEHALPLWSDRLGQVGYLHSLRSGRPALALDLMEELRPLLADRLALTLINRRQVTATDFEERPGGAVLLGEKACKTVVVAYQKRKQDEVHHPVVDQKMPLGLVAHTQARLLARCLRGDLGAYPPFLYR